MSWRPLWIFALAALAAPLAPPAARAAGPAGAIGPARPRLVEQLTVAERASLPDATPVMAGKVSTTLGRLRLEHLGAAQRFSGIPTAAAARQAMYNARVTGLSKSVVEPASGYKDGAADMLAFCNARQATVCLYYPPSTTLFMGGGWSSQLDPYITDKAVCASQNGVMLVSGCQYNYPTWYTANFVVGVAGFTSKVECDPTYWKVLAIDQHGAVAVQTTVAEGATFTTGAKASTCVIYATPK